RQSAEAGSTDHFRVLFPWRAFGQDIPSQLLPDELVERLVTVERVDDVVAVAHDLGYRIVRIVAGRVGVMDDVHPMPPPAFAVMGRGQEASDDTGEGVRRVIVEEFGD